TVRERGCNRGRTSLYRARPQPFRRTLRVGIAGASIKITIPRPQDLHSGDHPPTRRARARVNTPTEVAPARFKTRAHSSTVAQVVNTSSTITPLLPAKLRPARTVKAPRTLRSRAAGPK